MNNLQTCTYLFTSSPFFQERRTSMLKGGEIHRYIDAHASLNLDNCVLAFIDPTHLNGMKIHLKACGKLQHRLTDTTLEDPLPSLFACLRINAGGGCRAGAKGGGSEQKP